jgi:hypothetical protein
MKFNDLNLEEWKSLDINVNSLWIIDERAKFVFLDLFHFARF